MKIIYLLTVYLFAATSLFSQEFSSPVNYRLDYFIGRYNDKDLYVTTDGSAFIQDLTATHGRPTTFSRKGKQALISYSDGVYTKEKEWPTTLFRPEKWFLHQGTLYAATLKNINGFAIVQLTEFSKTFQGIDSTVLTENPVLKYDEIHVRFDQMDDYLTVLCNSDKSGNTGAFTVFDLENRQMYNQSFELEDLTSVSCGGVVVNNRAELLAVFERVYDTGVYSSKKDITEEAYLLNVSRTHAELMPVKTQLGDQFRNSLRLCKVNDNKVLLGGLVFVQSSGNMVGYITVDLKFGSTILANEHITYADFSRPELWITKEAGKFTSDKPNSILKNQYLKDIRKLEDGSVLFISEGCNVHVSASTMAYRHPAFDGNTVMIEDLIISRIQNGEVQWTNKTKFREDITSAITVGVNPTKAGYFLCLNEVSGYLSIYYPEQKASFDESGELNDKRTRGASRMTIAVLKLDLLVGNGKVRALFPDFNDLPGEVLFHPCSHLDAEGNPLLMTWRQVGGPSYRQIVLTDE